MRIVGLVTRSPGYAEAIRGRLDAIICRLDVDKGIGGPVKLLESDRMNA